MKSIAIVVCLLVLTGCASSSGVVSTGQDTYMVAKTQKGFRGASGIVLAEAIKEADEYCKQRGLVMKVVRTTNKDMVPFKSDAQAEVYFMALPPGDPRLKEETK
jgi:hypothetical protein